MQVKLKTNQYSSQTNKIPYYTDWDHVLLCQLGDVQDTFLEQAEIDCWLICGKDGKNEMDYFALVQIENIEIWVHHHFLYDESGNKLNI